MVLLLLMISHVTLGCISSLLSQKRKLSSNASPSVMNNYILKIKHIRSDNGTDFNYTSVHEFLDEMGITHEFSAPYTP